MPAPAANAVAPHVFFATSSQRVGLARQRFFDDGTRPTGLVSDALIQSWARCAQADRSATESVSFEPVTRSRIDSTMARNRLLLDAAREDLQQLQTLLAGTGCKALLTDARCCVVHATHTDPGEGPLMWLAGRVGVDLSEGCVGTTAPGMVVLSGQGCTVHGAEHYFHTHHDLHCAAAPIRDMHGQLVAVLDLTSEARAFRFDAAALVHLYAISIESNLLTRQAKPQVLLRFQASAQLLHTPLEGLAAVDENGGLLWMNAAGRSLLQPPQAGDGAGRVEEAFGLKLGQLMAAARARTLLVHRLPNGLQLCVHAQTALHTLRAAPALPARAAPPAPAPAPAVAPKPITANVAQPANGGLQQATRQLIETYVFTPTPRSLP